ncbi:MAG: hypothetical protein OEV06_06145 [Anaerolineae bacterium]|nr:hypothetical protein [Anaerolineae bacterium]
MKGKMMKPRVVVSMLMIMALATACGGNTTISQDEKLAAAQQTLDALNASVGGDSPAPTTIPQSNDNVDPSDGGTSSGSNDDLATPTSAVSRSSDLNNITILELDDNAMAWQTNCYYIRQEMGEFGDGWNEDDHWFGSEMSCEMAFDLPIAVSGNYDIYLAATYAPDFGILQIQVYSGIETIGLSNISLYDPQIMPTGEIFLAKIYFTVGGTAQFVVYLNDKAPESTDYKFGLDYLKLVFIP